MSGGGLAQGIRKLIAGVETRWGRLDINEIAKRFAKRHPWAIVMFGARKLFFGILFLIVVAILLFVFRIK